MLKFQPYFACVLSCLFYWWAAESSVEERKLLSRSSPGFTGCPPAACREEIPVTELSPPTVVCFAGIWLCWRDGRQMELVWEEKKIGVVKWNMNRRPTPVRRRFYEEIRETLSFLPPLPYGKQHILRAKPISGARNAVGKNEVMCVCDESTYFSLLKYAISCSSSQPFWNEVCCHMPALPVSFIFKSLSHRLLGARRVFQGNDCSIQELS